MDEIRIGAATAADVPAIVDIVDRAYRHSGAAERPLSAFQASKATTVPWAAESMSHLHNRRPSSCGPARAALSLENRARVDVIAAAIRRKQELEIRDQSCGPSLLISV
jgi:hypothetical protein